MQMASRKRKSSTSRPQEPYDTTRFISEVTWERYKQNLHSKNILPERNMDLYVTQYDKFRKELERR